MIYKIYHYFKLTLLQKIDHIAVDNLLWESMHLIYYTKYRNRELCQNRVYKKVHLNKLHKQVKKSSLYV